MKFNWGRDRGRKSEEMNRDGKGKIVTLILILFLLLVIFFLIISSNVHFFFHFGIQDPRSQDRVEVSLHK